MLRLKMEEKGDGWKTVWRDGLAPQFSRAALESLRDALIRDDPALIQGGTVKRKLKPGEPYEPIDFGAPCDLACVIGWCGWKGHGATTKGEVVEFVERSSKEADRRLGRHTAMMQFVDWVDGTPRDEMRRELLVEVEASLKSCGEQR